MHHAEILKRAENGQRLSDQQALALEDCADLAALTGAARQLRDSGHGSIITYSRKVFIPLTNLCRDVCGYCTFAQAPKKDQPAYLSLEQVLDIAKAGAQAGCHEALFTLGDKPELRYRVAREALEELGFESTLDYLAEAARVVHAETGLLPHLNPGVMTRADLETLRTVSVSMGLMLESISERLCGHGGPHYGSPDKRPALRLATLEHAGELAVPFTTGILMGIGETRRERIESLLAIRASHERHGHVQEIIVQNFRAKPDTSMANAPEPDLEDHLWTIAVARLVFGSRMSIQSPPNLRAGELNRLLDAGINDWGGVSPVTPDHVNPEAPWPHLEDLRSETLETGKTLVQRLAVYPRYAREYRRWLDTAMHRGSLRRMDAEGYAREDDWSPGASDTCPEIIVAAGTSEITPYGNAKLEQILAKAVDGDTLVEAEIVRLFEARGRDLESVLSTADGLRARVNGGTVSYVVNRNINYTNVCYFRCQFCAFSKGKTSENLRGRPYDLELEEVARRALEAWERGATEVCMQGGIHPDYTGETYLALVRAVKAAVPDMHVHAFTPLEVWQGARTLRMPVSRYLEELQSAGLGSLPGTAAEILDDDVRAEICQDKIDTAGWLDVMRAAHAVGLASTATIMFGHVDRYHHWARHLLHVRELQAGTGGFTEFVPLPFVHMEAPMYRKGRSRRGPTFREAILMHAVARLALHPLITNIQASWVKMGPEGAKVCLQSGANDLGGTLMNETITRSAGAAFGQELPPEHMEALILEAGRTPRQRTTLYGEVSEARRAAAFEAAPLREVVNRPATRHERRADPIELVRPGDAHVSGTSMLDVSPSRAH